ncbi:MAG: hypothetical protein OXC46_11640 [Thaumarchaeota archaeon]|nr:hypothetical protein [Nitrososphaerota archaeon]
MSGLEINWKKLDSKIQFGNFDDFEFGRILRIDKYTQIHVKVDSRGCIEGEIEYLIIQ